MKRLFFVAAFVAMASSAQAAFFSDYAGNFVSDKSEATFVFEVTGAGEVSVGGVCDEDGNITCAPDSGYSLTIPEKVKDESGVEYTVTSFREKLYFDGTTDGAFSTCFVKKMYVPATIRSLGACAFKGCNVLVYLNFASKVPPSIGANAFVGTQLKNGAGAIDVPFGYGPTYKNAEGWTDSTNAPYLIHLHDYNSPAIFYFDAAGNLVDSAAEATLAFTQTSLTEVKVSAANGDISGEIVIPEKIVGSDGVEYTVTALSRKQNDHVGGNLTGAFSWCDGITKVVLPATIADIPERTFENCTALVEVELSEGLETVGSYAFHNCGIKNLSLPSTLESIGKYAFWLCEDLEYLEMKPAKPPVLSADAFSGCGSLGAIFVPKTSLVYYMVAPGWTSKIAIINPTPAKPSIKSIACADGKVTVGFEATEGYSYKLMRSGDLSFADAEEVDEVFDDGTPEGTTLVDEGATAPTAFYKVEITTPLQNLQE